MKKLLKKYVEVYPDGYLSQFLSVLIEHNLCEEAFVMDEFTRLKQGERINPDEIANFENLLKSYEQI